MPIKIIESQRERELQPNDLDNLLAKHPPELSSAVRELLDQADFTLRIERLSRLADVAVRMAARQWIPAELAKIQPAETVGLHPELALLAKDSDLPVYQFISPPAALVSENPAELTPGMATRTYSAFKRDSPDLMAQGNGALAQLLNGRYVMPTGDDKGKVMSAFANLLRTIGTAARSFPLMVVNQVPHYLELAPGDLPPALAQCFEDLVRSARPEDVLDIPLLNRVGKSMGLPERPAEQTPALDVVAAFYMDIRTKLWDLSLQMPNVMQDLTDGKDVGWWLDGESLSRPVAPKPDALKTGAGEHLVIPGLIPRPTRLAPPQIPTPSPRNLFGAAPIVLTVSDLHLGQGAWDNADEGYPELETALVAMLDSWAIRVTQHRSEFGVQPAYLVLNGDVLDFWSADLKELPGGGDRFQLDVENVNGEPQLNANIAGQRMRRILDNHARFFQRIRTWVDSNSLNFVVYVCGNHDDHLERFGLGGALAAELGGSRGAFAAKSLHFPELSAIIEHGHRTDVFNAWQGDGREVGTYGSLGEVLVATLINPAERGGAGALTMMETTFNSFLASNGIDADFLDDLARIYGHFRRCYEVEPSVYEGCMGSIDNIDAGGMEEVVADYTGRELVERNRVQADAANVSDLDEDLIALKSIWLKSDFQDLVKQLLAPTLARLLPPTTQAWLVDKVFAGDHAEKLGFEPGRGLFGDVNRRIHLVGHTHQPESTNPPIDGRFVLAQHVNTGTGQDTWSPYDDNQTDNLDLHTAVPGLFWLWGAVEDSRDRLTPVAKSNYCILRVVPRLTGFAINWEMQIEAGEFRSLQSHRPEDTPRSVRGGLTPTGTNFTILT